MSSFLDFGQAYVQYIVNCEKEQQPTVLTRIVGESKKMKLHKYIVFIDLFSHISYWIPTPVYCIAAENIVKMLRNIVNVLCLSYSCWSDV